MILGGVSSLNAFDKSVTKIFPNETYLSAGFPPGNFIISAKILRDIRGVKPVSLDIRTGKTDAHS
jgi:hypothetical protein